MFSPRIYIALKNTSTRGSGVDSLAGGEREWCSLSGWVIARYLKMLMKEVGHAALQRMRITHVMEKGSKAVALHVLRE